MNGTRVLALLLLFVELAHSFSWDVVMGEKERLIFYNNGTLEHTAHITVAHELLAVTYDPVYNRVLLADYHHENNLIFSYDVSTGEIERLVTKIAVDYNNIKYLVYDPVTQLLFWQEEDNSIYSFSLKPASSGKAVYGNLLVKLSNYCGAIAVDSCGGFIYWATNREIERAAFDGFKREVLINSEVYARRGLAIDQNTQTMYWTQEITSRQFSIESADLNGNNLRRFYFIGIEFAATDLSVSKNFIYWKSYEQTAILRLPKTQQLGVEPIVYSNFTRKFWFHQLTAANYKIKEQTLGIKSCKTLKSLILDVEERHGSICHNYCFQGNCSISAEGQPKCSCNRGYFGERCKVDACQKHCLNGGVCSLNVTKKPVCQCTADYQDERCDVSICKDYCLQGKCSVTTDRQPICRCTAGYSGERCEVHACHEHCVNNGDCSLSEENEPVCKCTAGFEGKRCDVASITHNGVFVKMTQQILRDLRGEVKEVIKEELQCTLQLYSDKLGEDAAKIHKCEELMKDDLQKHDEITSKRQTPNMNF